MSPEKTQRPPNKLRDVGGALHEVKPINNFILCAGGFTQRESQWDEGISALTRYLHETYAGPDLNVTFLHWDENMEEQADRIFGWAGGPTARVLFIGYSWSVGNGFRNLCHAFKSRGMRFERVVLSDGVYHYAGDWAHYLGISQFIACLPRPWGRPCIRLPQSVIDQIDWFVQSPFNFVWTEYETWLRGHRLIWDANKHTVPNCHEIQGVLHHWMDDSEPFQSCAIAAAKAMFGATA